MSPSKIVEFNTDGLFSGICKIGRYVDKPEMIDDLEDNIRLVITDIQPQNSAKSYPRLNLPIGLHNWAKFIVINIIHSLVTSIS